MKNITNYTLKKATEHIFYEAWMFFETIKILRKPISQISRNILLDAYAIHCRNLFLFLYPASKNQKDDILVNHYIEKKKEYNRNKTKRGELKFILKKANKQAAHLTYSRNRFGKKTKPWFFVDIGKKMHKSLVAFYEALPEPYQKWSYFIKLKKALNEVENDDYLFN